MAAAVGASSSAPLELIFCLHAAEPNYSDKCGASCGDNVEVRNESLPEGPVLGTQYEKSTAGLKRALPDQRKNSASCLVLLLSLLAILALAVAEVSPGGCQKERCGNVDIPYPFGISGSGCALDDSFMIDCKVISGMQKPFTGPFEVIKISAAESKAWIKMNFGWHCDGPKAEQRHVSLLQDSHSNYTVFRFSYADNKIFVIGCEILGSFVGSDMNLEHTESLLGSPSTENIRFDEEAVKSLEMGRRCRAST
ncbi:hypothetical protein EJB05_17929 [Eragrostis curvula]|uniref:Wall-associated receptor kinase galacturonan-binding domain-containing protein n=1 Tax=Eragrostis curvula TaxID=38414 RepID=A0A5J9VII7_9POAL|nr:hypothetical protein EJB05_17929 [Eragrostis curvula]